MEVIDLSSENVVPVPLNSLDTMILRFELNCLYRKILGHNKGRSEWNITDFSKKTKIHGDAQVYQAIWQIKKKIIKFLEWKLFYPLGIRCTTPPAGIQSVR